MVCIQLNWNSGKYLVETPINRCNKSHSQALLFCDSTLHLPHIGSPLLDLWLVLSLPGLPYFNRLRWLPARWFCMGPTIFPLPCSIDCAGILKLRNSDIELRKGETDIGRKNTRVRVVFRVHIPQPNGKVLSLQAASIPVECCESPSHKSHVQANRLNTKYSLKNLYMAHTQTHITCAHN